MAIVTKNPSSLKLRLNCGNDPETQKMIVKTKTFSNVKTDATDEDLYDVGKVIVSLQKHSLLEIAKIDNSTLSE